MLSFFTYATSQPDWIENAIATHGHEYETLDNDNCSSTSWRQPLYVNVAADGSLDLPPHLRTVSLEFQRSYENSNYKRLHKYVTEPAIFFNYTHFSN